MDSKYFKYNVWVFILLMLFCSRPTLSQEPSKNPPSNSEEQTIKIDKTIVNIPVVVKDKNGAFLSDLKAEDFTVYENGVKQQIELFSKEDAPANILIMMEASEINPSTLAYGKYLTTTLIEKIRPGDSVGIISFEEKLVTYTPRFTDDKNELVQALESAKSSSKKVYLRNAIFQVAQKLLKNIPGRKVIILISTGNDSGSSHSEKETLAEFIESDTVFYTLYYPLNLQIQRISSEARKDPSSNDAI